LAKLLKGILAFGAAALLLACAACGGNPDPTTTPETEAIITTAEPGTLEIVTSEVEETTEELTTVDVTTTAAPTTVSGKPSTKAEIVDYFNAAYKKVKAEKPGYTSHERTVIDKDKISSSKSWLESVASLVLPFAEGAFTKWTDPEVTARGADHSGLPPYVDVDPRWVKSAICTESGGNYMIRLNLVDESVPVLPKDGRTTIHGRMLDRGVYNWEAVMDGIGQIPVIKIEVNKFACKYSGSYLDAVIDRATGAVVKVTTWVNCQAEVEVKVPVFGALDASLPLGNESEYFNFGK